MTLYRFALTPDATIEVEDSGNVVIRTPERRITVTNVAEWISQLDIARTLAHIAAAEPVDPPARDEFGHTMADYRADPGLLYELPGRKIDMEAWVAAGRPHPNRQDTP
jgi:hypothetical protein